eukprot:2263957-Pyramimonas_sp.AAC.1
MDTRTELRAARSIHIHCSPARPILNSRAVYAPCWPSQEGVAHAPLLGSGWAWPGSSGYV